MYYIHHSSTPGMALADYERVVDALGDEPIDGQLSHLVGVSAGTLHIVDVWQSRAHADRFAAERLFPAFAASGIHPAGDQSIVTFEASEVRGL